MKGERRLGEERRGRQLSKVLRKRESKGERRQRKRQSEREPKRGRERNRGRWRQSVLEKIRPREIE